jgi:hypothetical protein
MSINFQKFDHGNTSTTALHPREIFAALPNKKEGRFEYPRDVQSKVWEHWFSRREEDNLVVKMNTGSGKTVVGLLILKSCLNEGKGPAVYIVPDKYLAKQVADEANALGIETVEYPDSPRFLSGKAILITNIFKLVNGKSVFGIGDEGAKIKIGSLMIDDAHACLDTIESQYTLSISSDSETYRKLYEIFKDSLHEQCDSKALEIENRDLDSYLLLPFWTWQKKISSVRKILIECKEEEQIKFTWPLIKESLELSRCVVSSNKIEISPHCIPIHMVSSIANANRRIFMTATLADDSILSSHFGIASDFINKPVTPDTAGDVGDRIILLPQIINPEINDDDIKSFCKSMSKNVNVVVIVPSESRAKWWRNEADLILNKDNLYQGITDLKTIRKQGLTILTNRYDGVDLPKESCRLLVIDGLPTFSRLIDKIETNILRGTSRKTSQLVQKIEQGMGRGVRSNDDYCAVLLMGRDLTSRLYEGGATEMFSPATKAQMELSEEISGEMTNGSLDEIKEIIMYCLNKDQEWLSISKGRLSSLSYGDCKDPDEIVVSQRRAYDYALVNQNSRAIDELNTLVNKTQDIALKSFLMQCMAEYVNREDEVEAQKILISAANNNRNILKPMKGITYSKLESDRAMGQARRCSNYLTKEFDSPNEIMIRLNDLLESLAFVPDTADSFENALREIASYIGFDGQRPEAEYGKGPDVLWGMGELEFLVIECKNGAVVDTITKNYCNQLNGSGEWFVNKYDSTCNYTPILVHPSTKFENAASPKRTTKIIDKNKLALLCKNVSAFIKALCTSNTINNENIIREQLITYKLRASEFCETYTKNFSSK